jgi:hypothetical protein
MFFVLSGLQIMGYLTHPLWGILHFSVRGMALKYIVTDMLKAFLGNNSVKTFKRATVETVSQWTNV